MKNELKRYHPIGEVIASLFSPQVEVVIHDLKTGLIDAIFNNFSKRKVGDESLVDRAELADSRDLFPPYFKTDWDGRKMKSATAVLKDEAGSPIGLLCINIDLSKWEEMHRFILDFLKPISPQPEILFKNDWREKINLYVRETLKQKGLCLEALDREEKQKLLIALYQEGAFESKNAAAYIADVLQISRATVYNYLKAATHATV